MIVAALVVVAALVALGIFFPAIGAVVIPIVASVATGIASFIVAKFFNFAGGIFGLGLLATAAITLKKTIPEWREEEDRILKEELESCERELGEIKKDLDNLKNHHGSVAKTMDAMVNHL